MTVITPRKEIDVAEDRVSDSSDKQLTLSLLMTAQEAFVDSADHDQTAQNVQSDL